MTKLIEKFIRDVTKVKPMPKSEVRERLDELLAIAFTQGVRLGIIEGGELKRAEELGRDLRKLGKKK